MSLFSNDATVHDSFFGKQFIIPSGWGHINQPIERFQYVGALKEPIKGVEIKQNLFNHNYITSHKSFWEILVGIEIV